MQIKEITSLLHKSKPKLVVLLCHQNADPDALGASFALSGLLKRLKPSLETEIVVASGPSKISKSIMEIIPLTLGDGSLIDNADLLFLVDTNTIQQLGILTKKIRRDQPIVIIDHHAPHPETENIVTLSIIDDTASSTCEIVYRLFDEAKEKPNLNEAKALFLGIAYDSKHFILATSDTFKIVHDLIEIGVKVQEMLKIFSIPMENSERLARLKSSNRMEMKIIDGWIIAFSDVSSYQASASRALLSLGAHLAIVAGKKGETIQVSLRASQEFYNKTGVHVGRDLAKPLGEFLGGMGGGHSTSAGANGFGELETCLDFCVKLIQKKLM